MCIFLNLADGMVHSFFESIKSGVDPTGKPWTKEGVKALHIYFDQDTINELTSLHEMINDGFVVSKIHGKHIGFDYDPNMGRPKYSFADDSLKYLADHMAGEIKSIAYDEFASLDEAPDEDETEEMDDDEGDDEILEDDDDVLHGEDPPAAALPSSLTDLLNVANHDRILEAA